MPAKKESAPTEHDVLLRAKGIVKVYSEGKGSSRTVLNGPDLEIRRGSLVVIRGENGSGKSTLLRILGLVDRDFDDGYLEICQTHVGGAGQTLSAAEVEDFRARHIGFVFQDDLLHPLLSLRKNSELPIRIHRWPEDEIKAHLDRLQSDIFRPDEIKEQVMQRGRKGVSSGQRQRAAILRALSHNPDLILADEPTASLDPDRKDEVVEIFKKLCDKGATILVASHDSIFHDVGETYTLAQGKLHPETRVVRKRLPPPQVERLPGCPMMLKAEIALREARGNPLFALIIGAAMAAGLFQLTLLWSIRAGTENVLNQLINKGSRLDRIAVAAKAQTPDSSDGGLPSQEVLDGLSGVRSAVPRREILLRVNDSRGRERQETTFGLIKNDPEIEKLELREGKPFEDQQALAVLITERSVERLFGAGAVGETTVGRRIRIRFRRYQTAEDWEGRDFEFVIQGVLDRAEAGRNLYLPQGTLRAIATWEMDSAAELDDPEGRLELVQHELGEIKPTWDRLDVYFNRLDGVLPAAAYLERRGFSTTADLYRYKWILDTQRFVSWMLISIVFMVVLITGSLIISNVITGVRLKRKEIAILKLMGMKDRDVVSIFVLSVLVCALLGGAVGFLSSSLVVDRLGDYLTDAYPESPFGQVLTSTWAQIGYALLLCSGVSVFFTVAPIWWMARKEEVWTLD